MASFRKPKRGAVVIETPFLHVAGLGDRLGHSREDALDIISSALGGSVDLGADTGSFSVALRLEQIHLVATESFLFLELESVDKARFAQRALDGCEVQEQSIGPGSKGRRRVMRVSFAERRENPDPTTSRITCTAEFSSASPEGLVLYNDFVSPQDEELLLAALEGASWEATLNRRVLHWG